MKKDVLWNSLGVAAWSFLSLILLIVVTRINGIDDSGLFSYAFAVALIMYTIACYGGRTYQVSDHHEVFSTDSYISLRILTTLAVIALSIVFVLANGYDARKSALVLILVAHRAFDAIADVFYGVLQKNHRLYIAGKSLFYKSVLSLIGFVAIDLLTGDLLLACLPLVGASLLFVVCYDIPQSRRVEQFQIRVRTPGTARILSSTFLPFVVAALILIFANIARYFIDVYHPQLQGYFGIIIMPLSLIILLFSFVSGPVIVPLSRMFNTREFAKLHAMVGRIIVIMLAATVVLAVLAYFLAAPVLQLLFAIDFGEYATDVVLIVFIGAALSLTSLFTQIAIIARRLRFTASVYVLVTVLLIVLCVILTGPYEIRGAIMAYVIAALVQLLVMGGYYLRLTRPHKPSINSQTREF